MLVGLLKATAKCENNAIRYKKTFCIEALEDITFILTQNRVSADVGVALLTLTIIKTPHPAITHHNHTVLRGHGFIWSPW